MASGRFSASQIETLMPSVDPRASNKTFLLDGKNFLWDSKGPKSGFGSAILTPFPLMKPRDVHGVRVRGRSFVFTQDSILAWRTSTPYMWELLASFETEVSLANRFPWQVVYLNGKMFLSHPARGFFSADVESSDALWLHGETSSTIPGLPPGIKGMVIVRGRAIMANDYTVTWSNTGDLSDLTPELGGAGFQVIAGIVKGTYVALTGLPNGFIVWTTEGALIAEFIGGDEVWRIDPLESQERPISAWATLELTTGGSAMLSRRGLFTNGTGSPEPWTPQFNEYFRDYTQHKDLRKIHFRLEYDTLSETIYLLESNDLVRFTTAWVMKPTLDKWGLFSEVNYGILPVTDDRHGYVDSDGIVHYFNGHYGRETDPANADGLDRHYPLLQKTVGGPSTSGVSRAITFNLTVENALVTIPQPGWYTRGTFLPASPTQGGMGSWIEIGYLRPDELNMAADAFAEFQEIAIGGIPVAAPLLVDYTTQWNEEGFYLPSEDWDSPVVLTEGDEIIDFMLIDAEVDKMSSGIITYADKLNLTFGAIVTPTEPDENWNANGLAEDWNSPVSAYPALTYNLLIRSSQDGITFEEYEPVMAKFNSATQEFTTMTSGTYHAIRVEATESKQWYHVRALDLTMYYGGQQA